MTFIATEDGQYINAANAGRIGVVRQADGSYSVKGYLNYHDELWEHVLQSGFETLDAAQAWLDGLIDELEERT